MSQTTALYVYELACKSLKTGWVRRDVPFKKIKIDTQTNTLDW